MKNEVINCLEKKTETIKGKEDELSFMKAKELGNLYEDSSDLSFVVEQVKSPTTKGKSLRNKWISKVNLPRTNAKSRRVKNLHRRYTLTKIVSFSYVFRFGIFLKC